MNNYICTWLYLEKDGEESNYPQVGGKSSSSKFHNVYWRCVYSFFYSTLISNPNCKYIFFTNSNYIPEYIDNINLKNFFNLNNIKIINLELSEKAPIDWYGSWRNQFYVFDILNYINNKFKSSDNFIILDSDCLVLGDLSEAFSLIKENGAICYDIGYNKNEKVNGLSLDDMKNIYNVVYNDKREYIKYYGGELIGVNREIIAKICLEYKNLWKKNYKFYEAKKEKLNEEAHFLSIIYNKLNINNNLANFYIKRMWTSSNYNNISSEDEKLPIWHLPAEKKTGFIYFFKDIDFYSLYNKEALIKKSKRYMGIPNKSIAKRIKDIYYKIIYRLK